ncbi:MAG: dTDP-4-dehydrorhamnose reductase [Clostridia bacterium]|nr:dTDP-4-dehydrorhamnose reductase [Clostridia bacterium]
MKVWVTGAAGQLGHDVMKRLYELNIEAKGTDVQELDLTDRGATLAAIESYQPDVVVHCAAYTAVDQAEDEPEKCARINVDATRNVALGCQKTGAKLVYISTDYVFNGQGEHPFLEDQLKEPINAYGLTKAQGEDVCRELVEKLFIVRISWVFGINGKNFVKTMLRLGAERKELTVVCDQIGSPTYTWDLAQLLCQMIQTQKYGVYHATNEGYCSWQEFAQAIMDKAGLDCIVKPILSKDYPAKAKRPFNSRMSKKKLDEAGFARLPHWEDALERYLQELKDQAGN